MINTNGRAIFISSVDLGVFREMEKKYAEADGRQAELDLECQSFLLSRFYARCMMLFYRETCPRLLRRQKGKWHTIGLAHRAS